MHGDHDDDVEQDGERRRGNNDFLLKVLIPNALLLFLVFGLSASVDIRYVVTFFFETANILLFLLMLQFIPIAQLCVYQRCKVKVQKEDRHHCRLVLPILPAPFDWGDGMHDRGSPTYCWNSFIGSN